MLQLAKPHDYRPCVARPVRRVRHSHRPLPTRLDSDCNSRSEQMRTASCCRWWTYTGFTSRKPRSNTSTYAPSTRITCLWARSTRLNAFESSSKRAYINEFKRSHFVQQSVRAEGMSKSHVLMMEKVETPCLRINVCLIGSGVKSPLRPQLSRTFQDGLSKNILHPILALEHKEVSRRHWTGCRFVRSLY